MTTRTRFAPSPTGYLHVGAIRTGLYAWLIARQNNGQFILRLEDTDKSREVEGSDQHIMTCLKALGLQYDEGPDQKGQYGPYRQSLRLEGYKTWAQKLIDAGRAYADPYTPAEVQAFRESAQKNKQPFLYRNHRPENPPQWDGGKPLRFKSDPKNYTWTDAVMGEMSTGPEVIDDFILIKSDGYPTYNFAHIVDDADMEISHVIRGQEFLASTPNYLNLYEALSLDRPILATVPPILGANGNKKLSKRDGAKDILEYLNEGIIPEVLVNFIASLGWNDGTEQELFTTDELIKKFSLDRVQRSGAKFDDKRLLWMNGAYIRDMELNDLYDKIKDYLPESSQKFDEAYRKQVIGLCQERLKFFSELPELTEFFFSEPTIQNVLNLYNDPRNKQLKKVPNKEIKQFLVNSLNQLQDSNFTTDDLAKRLNGLLDSLETKPGILFSIIRIAISGSPASPQLFDTLSVIGKDKSLQRIQLAIDNLGE